ncbi:hypothetical protein GNF82_14325 [Clostridium perfringens]
MFNVGQKCPVSVLEGNIVVFEKESFTLFVRMSFLEESDIEVFKTGAIQLALSGYSNKTLFFVYRIEGFTYFVDAPFSIYNTEGKLNNIKHTFADNFGYEFNMVLIEDETNIIKATRQLILPVDSSIEINQAITEQFDAGFEGFEEEVKEAYSKYSGVQLFNDLRITGITFKN